MKTKLRYYQQGAETVEFAFVAVFYFALLFGVFEFARALYTWNVLTEATRRGARMAAVCPYIYATPDIPKPQLIPLHVAIYDDLAGSSGGSSPILANLKEGDITIRYLNADANDDGVVGDVAVVDIAAGGLASDIDFVEVTINYQHQMLFTNLFSLFVPGWTGALTSPTFQTTLPAESLGADPTFSPPALPVTCNF